MIAQASGEGRNILILGLTPQNIASILHGNPLMVSERTNAPKGSIPGGIEIMICVGASEKALLDQFKQEGLIGTETKHHIDPRLGDDNAPRN